MNRRTTTSLPTFNPKDTLFIILSFEGPDVYSQAGGLGVRVTELARALSEQGNQTHLFFVGDPKLPAKENLLNNKLFYHRWGQWISQYHPKGVYDGEEGKVFDFQRSLPGWLHENIFTKNASKKTIVVMAEEWHTAYTLISLAHLLSVTPFKDKTFFLWNANNTFGFNRIDWGALQRISMITTVSKYMKHIMWNSHIDPHVISNGIPERWFAPIEITKVTTLRKALGNSLLIAKVGRFDPDKRWMMAIHSIALLKRIGLKPKLMMRGGIEPHGEEIRYVASTLGLKRAVIKIPKESPFKEFCAALEQNKDADIFDLQFFVSEELLRLIYRSANAVLANSRHEPFGLVGLEVMSCQGIAVTGNTGEDYAQNFQNGIVIETDDPWELTTSLSILNQNSTFQEKLRKAAQKSAENFKWPLMVEELKRKLTYLKIKQN